MSKTMTTTGLPRSITTKLARNLEKPKPLKASIAPARHSAPDVPGKMVAGIMEEMMAMVENLTACIANKNYPEIQSLSAFVTLKLKVFGVQLEDLFKDRLDRAFLSFRDAANNFNLDDMTRTALLEVIELRAMNWQARSAFNMYYNNKNPSRTAELLDQDSGAGHVSCTQLLLAPGEVLKSSGKFSNPTKMAGKNYSKDEVVIRNADSGKVMGIKGRRVHMIEELSETVISFQRVAPGAKERLVQITGPTEDKISLARNLIEDTIKRNASPVKEIFEKDGGLAQPSGSNASSSSMEENFLGIEGYNSKGHDTLLDSVYKYTIPVGSTNICLISDEFDLINVARFILEDHFENRSNLHPKKSGCETKDASTQCSEIHEKLEEVKSAKRYNRELLLLCSESYIAKQAPPGLLMLLSSNPNIERANYSFFDRKIYEEKWNSISNQGAPPVLYLDTGAESE